MRHLVYFIVNHTADTADYFLAVLQKRVNFYFHISDY